MKQAAAQFLACKRIAVTASRGPRGGVEAVVIATSPKRAEGTMRECADLGVQKVWMRLGFGAGSVSADAAQYGRAPGITVIDGGCPLMFEPAAGGVHKAICAYLRFTRKLPR